MLPKFTDRLQPLDLSVNKPLKNEMRKKFMEWYSNSITDELDSRKYINQVQVGLQISTIKPLSANWFIGAFDYIHTLSDIIGRAKRAPH